MEKPKVGVGVFVLKDNTLLMGKRKNALAAGTWGLPGGNLEFGEELEICAQREVLEETGIYIKNIKPAAFTNDIFVKELKHYITIFMIAEYASGEVQVCEPEKCEGWQWVQWDHLPFPCMLPLDNLKKTGFNLYQLISSEKDLHV